MFCRRTARIGKSVLEYRPAANEQRRNPTKSRDGVRLEKPLGRVYLTVPQTDTGRQVEDTKACEITIVKELGKLTP